MFSLGHGESKDQGEDEDKGLRLSLLSFLFRLDDLIVFTFIFVADGKSSNGLMCLDVCCSVLYLAQYSICWKLVYLLLHRRAFPVAKTT